MTVYVARTKKEFERVTGLLCELGIGWKNKANCGWNIEVNNDSEPKQLELACKNLLTASQILDGSEIPSDEDVTYYLDCCKKARIAIDNVKTIL